MMNRHSQASIAFAHHVPRALQIGGRLCTALLFAALCTISTTASAAVYHYVDWTAANVAGGTATGVITLPDASTVTVNFAAINPDGTPGNLLGAQTNGGTNYWNPSTPYTSSQVENAPPDTDILQLLGGQNQTYVVTLSEAIKDPIMAVLSLGQPNVPTTYDFDSPFTIVSQGQGYWGGNATALTQLPDDVLVGNEGHGTIQFIGTFPTFSWTVPTPENWHGFTFGIRTTERIEPTPVPEPGTVALMLAGLTGLGLIWRRKQG
jgi:PEP-CTERM motif